MMIIITACAETYIEENQNAYTAQDVVPLVMCKTFNCVDITLEVRASNIPAQNLYKKFDFKEEGLRKGYYSDNGEDAIIMWCDDITPYVTPEKVVEVNVASFCQFDINNFIGAYSCDEAGYGPYDVNFTIHPTMANTIVNDNFWDYPAAGAVIYYTLSGDFLEEVTVPKQDFEFGDGYMGWVEGSGTYDGCAYTMTMVYTVFYEGDEYTTYHSFSPATKGTTYNITLKKSKEYFNR